VICDGSLKRTGSGSGILANDQDSDAAAGLPTAQNRASQRPDKRCPLATGADAGQVGGLAQALRERPPASEVKVSMGLGVLMAARHGVRGTSAPLRQGSAPLHLPRSSRSEGLRQVAGLVQVELPGPDAAVNAFHSARVNRRIAPSRGLGVPHQDHAVTAGDFYAISTVAAAEAGFTPGGSVVSFVRPARTSLTSQDHLYNQGRRTAPARVKPTHARAHRASRRNLRKR
jgi:hypothetical protein